MLFTVRPYAVLAFITQSLKYHSFETTLDTMCAKQFSVRSSQCCPVLSSALNSMYMGGRCAQCTPAQVQARLSAHSDSFLRVQF